MNELQVISLDNTDISTWDFPALKAELQAVLSDYDGLVYTDETIVVVNYKIGRASCRERV